MLRLQIIWNRSNICYLRCNAALYLLSALRHQQRFFYYLLSVICYLRSASCAILFHVEQNEAYDVIVVGAGHAGCEAALASARMGRRTLLITQSLAHAGCMPCNPSIGGLAKSHLVFELDALGGEMARNTDVTGIQFRVLNTSRGPAVRANRTQCDKHAYTRRMQAVLAAQPNLTLMEDECVAIVADSARKVALGVRTANNGEIRSRTTVITSGTALRGVIFIGDEQEPGGGGGRPGASALSESLEGLGFELRRLKTGTPPRLHARSIDWSKTTPQGSDWPLPMFHVEHFSSRRGVGENNAECRMQNAECVAGPVGNLTQRRREAESAESASGAGPSTFNLQPSTHPTTEPAAEPADDLTQRRGDAESACGAGPSTFNLQPSASPASSIIYYPLSTIYYLPRNERGPAERPLCDVAFTHTTAETARIVRENLSRSALYGGAIRGVGVRYCPSFEDKIVKFTSHTEHHVILEPESPYSPSIYPNGLSNSLPREVQEEMVHSVPGLEKAEFIAYGYAIEYDAIDARELSSSLESKRIEGLFFAGQTNGTTGYEEAAAQGIMAGANAALKSRGEAPLTLSRREAYIGVMIDDLVTKGADEPYRMFTSRAERRLALRQDNACFRLIGTARRLGIVPEEELDARDALVAATEREIGRISAVSQWAAALARPEAKYFEMPFADKGLDPAAAEQVEIHFRYAGYMKQEEERATRMERSEAVRIPADIDYHAISALRYESRERLSKVRPENLGQAGRIPGVTPADIAVLEVALRQRR